MIVLEDLSIQQGSFTLKHISLRVPRGCYAVLMGKTGTGKTTILEAIAGLRHPRAGRVVLGGLDVTWRKPALRNIGYVPQDRALFPTMSVAENLAFALTVRYWPKEAIRQRGDELADMLGIRHILSRGPRALSGGECQRVALGRALAVRPPILLLDEPLSALDDETRLEIYDLLESVRAHTGVTTLHVSHHLADAQRLADRVLLLQDGQVKEEAVVR